MPNKLKAGDRVKHAARTDWGLGEVWADEREGGVKVFFEDAGFKELVLEHASIIRVCGEEAGSDHLTALVKSYKAEQSKPPVGKQKAEFMPFPKATQNFLSYFPNGFMDPRYLEGKDDRAYKLAATKLMLELLGLDIFGELLHQERFKDVCDRARSVINKTNLIHQYEKMWLADGLAADEHQKKFTESLWGLLYGNGEMSVRFERFVEMLYEIGAAKWPIATYFLFITFPDSQMFVKPEVTKNAANILKMEINLSRPEPNWLTYIKYWSSLG